VNHQLARTTFAASQGHQSISFGLGFCRVEGRKQHGAVLPGQPAPNVEHAFFVPFTPQALLFLLLKRSLDCRV
jgi:hypothetical protein